jgi:hypothetical protein
VRSLHHIAIEQLLELVVKTGGLGCVRDVDDDHIDLQRCQFGTTRPDRRALIPGHLQLSSIWQLGHHDSIPISRTGKKVGSLGHRRNVVVRDGQINGRAANTAVWHAAIDRPECLVQQSARRRL